MTDDVLDRIRQAEQGTDGLNAFVTVAEQPPTGAPGDGPLAGMPVAVKDNIATLELPTTCGSRLLEGYVYHLMELLIIIDALRRSSARRITAVIPYFGYARQDRRASGRTPISAKLVANLITEAGADRILTLDLHAGQIQGFFDIPTDNLFAAPVMTRDIKERYATDNVMVVSPDVGGVVRARALAKRIEAPLSIVDKRRDKPGESEVMNIIGEVKGYDCILVDDIVDSGGTLCNAAEALLSKGAKSVTAYITHGVLSGGAVARVTSSKLKELVITNSIEPTAAITAAANIRAISIAPLIGEAINRTALEKSVSSLFS